MFDNIGGGEIILILLVVLIFFGPKKLPELMASLGKGLRKFNDAKTGIESQVKVALKEPLDAISGAKDGLESKLREIAEPLNAELKMPHQGPGRAPILAPPEQSLPKGSLVEPKQDATTAEGSTAEGSTAKGAATEGTAAEVTTPMAETPAPTAAEPAAPTTEAPTAKASDQSVVPPKEA